MHWEELDSKSELPKLTNITPEISMFLSAIDKQKEEERLFQFLNGLDDKCSPQRSQILLITPLPTLESACSLIQQEESQRDALQTGFVSQESTALYSKGEGVKDKCIICGFKGHPPEKCLEKVGYPSWHYKSKQAQGNKFKAKSSNEQHKSSGKRFAANASTEG